MFHNTIFQTRFAIAVLALLMAGIATAQEKRQPEYTVHYLKYVDATEVARSLQVLLGDSDNNVRIVPESRINALFVSGPETALAEVEQFLKILDQQSADTVEEIKIFPLQNLIAQDAQTTVNALVGDGVQISADPKTNSLVVTGQKENLAAIETILRELEKLSGLEKRTKVTTVDLEHITPRKALDVLDKLRVEAHIAVDESHNRLLISSDNQTFEGLLETIEKIDLPDRTGLEFPVQVRLVWLMEDKTFGEKPPSSDTEIDKVARHTEKRLGLFHLKSVAQLLVNVEPEPSGEARVFTARGTAELQEGTLADLEFEGALTGGSKHRPVMEFSVHATQRPEAASNGDVPQEVVRAARELASLNSKVGIPAGHSVVLGVTSISSTSSVFILQMLPADPELQMIEE